MQLGPTWSRSFQGWFVIRGLGLAMVNLEISVSVGISPRYVVSENYRVPKYE